MFTATAAVLREPHGEFILEPVELDALRPDEVLVRIDACGICHTDVKYREQLPLPAVFGHEAAGTVARTGTAATRVRPGDRVILSYPWCGSCPWCERHEPFRCENIPALKFGGARMDGSKTIRLAGRPISSAFFQQSSFASHAITLERALVPINGTQPAALLAAIPCGVQTGAGAVINTFRIARGDSLIVFGAGTVGLAAVMAARVMGADPVICVDPLPRRLQLAQELGATHVLATGEEDITRQVRDILPRGVRYALETSATVEGLEAAIDCLSQGGAVGIVSFPAGGRKFPFTTRTLFLRVASLHGIIQGHAVPGEFLPRLLEWQRQGLFPVQKLITEYAFPDINRAFRELAGGEVIKAVLRMDTGAETG